jgi:hypothetical protein
MYYKMTGCTVTLIKNIGILEDWSNVTREDFHEYRANKMYLSARAGLPIPNPITAGAIASLPFVRPRDPLGEYRRGVRRDPNAIVSLKTSSGTPGKEVLLPKLELKICQTFWIQLLSLQHLKLLNSLWRSKRFVYAIFDKILLTDKGKSLVRQYASTFDAQKVFRDLTVYSNTSTMAARVALDLLTYITSSTLGDGTWKGTAQGFILNWQDKV